VIYEAPHRMKLTFRQLNSKEYGQGERACLCCRELTKVYEEFKRGTVSECLAWLETFGDSDDENRIRGEFTVVLGPFKGVNMSAQDIDEKIKVRIY
jgi:16S rRNA (cytidine1402-2'-O)-methyltransferase